MAITIDELLTIGHLKQWRIDRAKLQTGSIGTYSNRGWQERRSTLYDARVTRVIDLERAMSQLPEDERQAIILAYGNGEQHRTISRIIGVCDRTVHTKIAAARRHLADILGRLGIL